MGRIAAHTPSAERWLDELGAGWRQRRTPPEAIWSVIAALRRALAPASERDRALEPTLRVRGMSGTWVTLHASLAETTGERESIS